MNDLALSVAVIACHIGHVQSDFVIRSVILVAILFLVRREEQHFLLIFKLCDLVEQHLLIV